MGQALNDNIRQLRTLRGINQVEFASHLGVTKQCVSNWENDNVLPSVEMLVRIADFFRVSTDFLLGRVNTAALDVSGLTSQQVAHLNMIAEDLRATNRQYSDLLDRMRKGQPAPQDRS